jgi:hypothetical protein
MTARTAAPQGKAERSQMPEKSGPSISMAVEEIGPQKARAYLGENLHNRNLMPNYVERLKGAMERGEWVLNGEAIKFDEKGNLIDGQHRLKAIVESGVTIKTLVVRGLPFQVAQETMDDNRNRTVASILQLRGVADHQYIATGVNMLWRFQNGRMKRSGGSSYPTRPQAIALWEANQGLKEGVRIATRLNRQLRIAPGVLMAFYYILSRIDDKDADFFFEKLETGEDLKADDPKTSAILVLRRWYTNQMSRRSADRQPREHYAAVMIKAWNAYREGREIEVLNWSPGGTRNESFPNPK